MQFPVDLCSFTTFSNYKKGDTISFNIGSVTYPNYLNIFRRWEVYNSFGNEKFNYTNRIQDLVYLTTTILLGLGTYKMQTHNAILTV